MTFRPRPWRVILGFVLAPLVPAALFSVLASGGLGLTLLFAIFGPYPTTLVLGVPLYFLLKDWLRPRLVTTAAAGGVIATIPWLIFLPIGGAEQATVGQCVAILNGKTTWCGHLQDLAWVAMVFGLGCVGGIVFWLCVVWRADFIKDRPQPSAVPNASGTVQNR